MRIALLLFIAPALLVAQRPTITVQEAARFAQLALDCVHRAYPNKISHVLREDGDARPPQKLTPVFYGCYDWHSAVHGHWLLVRLVRHFPDAPFAREARKALARSFTDEAVAAEVLYLSPKDRRSFERPYGLAWLLQLCAELAEWKDPDGSRWSATLKPLEDLAAERFKEWLPKLSHSIRTGEHSQTAFALGLVLDWARTRKREDLEKLVISRVRSWHMLDRACNLAYEPGGQDFLSPCLAEADLMRRVLDPKAFADWLTGFLPDLPLDGSADWMPPAVVTDKTDGKLAHLDGLNLSRAWMLEGMAAGLPQRDPRRAGLLSCARIHRTAGLRAVTGEDYAGGHWLGSFATYLVTGRGIPQNKRPR